MTLTFTVDSIVQNNATAQEGQPTPLPLLAILRSETQNPPGSPFGMGNTTTMLAVPITSAQMATYAPGTTVTLTDGKA